MGADSRASFAMVLLPGLRFHSSAPRTLIHGDKKAGFTIFWADDGLDTGDLLLQKECDVLPDDTVNTLYSRFLFPEGVKGMVRSASRPAPSQGETSELARTMIPQFQDLHGELSFQGFKEAGLGHTMYWIRQDSCLQLSEKLNKV